MNDGIVVNNTVYPDELSAVALTHPNIPDDIKQLFKPQEDTASGTSLGSTEKPAGEFKSDSGTYPALSFLGAGKALNQGIDRVVSGVAGLPETLQNVPEDVLKLLMLPGDVRAGKIDPLSTQGIEKAFDLANLMVFGPAPVAAKMADGTLGSFMGVKSKTWNKEAAAKAEAMSRDYGSGVAPTEGIHPDDIWKDTGTFLGADMKWRQEIPDVNARLNMDKFEQKTIPGEPSKSNSPWDISGSEDRNVISLKPPENVEDILSSLFGSKKTASPDLESVLHHPKLYKAYPELRGIKVEPFPYETRALGTYSPGNRAIYLGKDLDPEYARGVLLHEVQHAIQDIEGFARGGSKEQFMSEEFKKQNYVLNEAFKQHLEDMKAEGLSKASADDILRQFNETPTEIPTKIAKYLSPEALKSAQFEKLQKFTEAKAKALEVEQDAFNKYQMIMGEVEARNVQTRRQYQGLQRLKMPPERTEDILRSRQINLNQ